MSTQILFPGDPTQYEDIEALPLEEIVRMMPNVSALKDELKKAVNRELDELADANKKALLKPEIERMINSDDMTLFLDELNTAIPKDVKMTVEQLKTTMEQRLGARPDAAGKSFNELAFLEIKEHLARTRGHAGKAGAKGKGE